MWARITRGYPHAAATHTAFTLLEDGRVRVRDLGSRNGTKVNDQRVKEVRLNPGDVVVAISTSGNSPNVVRAVDLANERGATVIGMTGFGAGKLGPMVDIHLHVPSDCIEIVEDIHLMLEHMITKVLREMTRS